MFGRGTHDAARCVNSIASPIELSNSAEQAISRKGLVAGRYQSELCAVALLRGSL
jgi:hypothetical protein